MDKEHGTSSEHQDKEGIPDKESNDRNTVETGAPQQKEMNKQPEEIQKKRKLSESDDTSDGNVVKRPALLAVKHKDTDESAAEVPPTISKNNADDDQNGGVKEREMTGNTMGDSHKDDEVITLSDDEDHEQTVKNPQKGEEEVQEEDSRAKSNSSVSDEADTSGFSDKSFVMPPVWNTMFDNYRDQLIEQRTAEIADFFDYSKQDIVSLKNGVLQIEADHFVESKIRLLRNAENVYDNLRWKRYLMLSEAMKRNREWNIPAYLLSGLDDESPDLISLEEFIITREIWPVKKETSSSIGLSEKSPDVITLDDDSDDIVPEEGSSFKDDVVVPIKGTKDQKSDSDGEKRLRSMKKATYTFEDDVYNSLIKISKLACDSLVKGDKDKAKKLREDVSNQLRRFKGDIERKTYTEILENANAFADERTCELLLSNEMGDNELFEAYLARTGNITNVTFCIYMCWIQSQRAFDWFRALDLVVMRMTDKEPRLE